MFAGTPATAVPALNRLVADHEVVGVLTREPKPVGRKRVLTESPVHQASRDHGLDVYTPTTLKDSQITDTIASLKVDAVAVVAYGLLIPQNLLSVPTYGWINLHYSLLPRWRGAAPVQYAIWNQDTSTGVTTFRIDEGLDTGDILMMHKVDIEPDETSGQLLDRLSDRGAELLSDTITTLPELQGQPQSGDTTYAPQLSSADGKLDLTRSAQELDAQIRAMTPAPGAWATWNGQRVKIGPARLVDVTGTPGTILVDKDVTLMTGDGGLVLDRIAPPGKSWMNASDWGRGLREEVVFS